MSNTQDAPVSKLASMFGTDKELEKNGVELQYGDIVFMCARAGGANARYNRVLETLTKPVRRMIQTETLPPDQLDQIFRQAYAMAICTGWWTIVEIKQDGEEKREPWIEHPMEVEGDGKTEIKLVKLPFNQANFITVMRDLPDLFEDMRQQTARPSLFKRDSLDVAVKN